MAIVTVGIDLAKNVFAMHGVDETGKAALVRPEVPRAKLLELIANVPPCLIGMEACCGAHHWSPALSNQPEPRLTSRPCKIHFQANAQRRSEFCSRLGPMISANFSNKPANPLACNTQIARRPVDT